MQNEAFVRFMAEVINNEPVEDKRAKSAELQKEVDHFLKNGGEIVQVPLGYTRLDEELPAAKDGVPISGKPGINWSPDRNKWSIRTPNSRQFIGYATSITEGLEMQTKHEKQKWKES
jgi:hypothetical protein